MQRAPSDKLSIYVPQKKAELRLVEKLEVIAAEEDRSINYLVVEAIADYVAAFETEHGEIELEDA